MTVKLVSQTQAGDRLLIGFEDTDVVCSNRCCSIAVEKHQRFFSTIDLPSHEKDFFR